MALPVEGRVHLVGPPQVVSQAGESLPTLVTQDTGVVAVDDTKDAVTGWVSRQCFGSGGQSATAVEPMLMCPAQLATRYGILLAAVGHALKISGLPR